MESKRRASREQLAAGGEAGVALAAMRTWSSTLTGPVSAIFLSSFLVVATDSMGPASSRTQALDRWRKLASCIAGAILRAIFWSRWKRRCWDRNGRFPCNASIVEQDKPELRH